MTPNSRANEELKGAGLLTMANNHCVALATSKPTRDLILGWLGQLGQEVTFVSSDAELLAHTQLAACPLVVVHVEQRHTLETCQALRSRPDTALLPQVVLADSEAGRQSAYEAGVEAVFMRTTLYTEILARLQALLKQHQFLKQWAAQQVQAAERGREQLRLAFRRYVSAQLADQIMNRLDPEMAGLTAGSRVQAAVMFADMRGFTGVAEKLAPAQVVELLNEFFSTLTAAAFRHDGTVFNMAGDSLMVGFGVPIAQTDGGIRALRAAREMLAGFNELAQRWQQRYGIDTGLGIGINEGEVIAGNIGSEQYMNYTLIGDTVNVAARLSQRARAGEVLFSNALKLSLQEAQALSVPMLALPPLILRGRSSPINIYCVPIDQRVDLRH
ncbi:MAG: adenylate/guanylate cyclase domain-containing protein [Steroidobacteraceae bacterium]